MSSSRTTSIGGVISLLGAFLAAAMVLGLLAAGLFMPAVGATGAIARSGVDIFNELPGEFKTDPLSQQSRILSADGKVIATPAEQNRVIVPLKKVAPIMREAQIAIEDHRFYDHGGFDLQGVVRAAIANIRTGQTTSGASSLTQQYVKISLQYSALNQGDKEAAQAAIRKDYMRKLKELKYAITLEKQMTKDEILQGYLNLVYYGDQAYGVEAASQHYFSIPASKLSLSQAALLAGLTQNPGTTDPVNYPERALARRNVVLDRMRELGKISDKDWTAAKKRTIKQDLKVSQPKSTCLASPYPYWCEFVINYVEAMPELGKTVEARRRLLRTGGITVHTTLDSKIQKIVQEEVTRKVPIGDPSNVGAAAYVTEPGTGRVLGFAQNTKYTVGKQSRGKTGIAWALDKRWGGSGGFQFGSTAKAFALLTAMESGMSTKASVNAKPAGDKPYTYQPSEFPQPCGLYEPWPVRNDTPWKGGRMSLMEATALSTNTAFVALAQQLGGCKVRDTMNRIGLHQADGKPMGKIPAEYILGADEVSPQGVAHAYATLAADGKKCSMVVVTKVTQGSKVLAAPKTKCDQVAKADYVRGTHKFLEYNMTNGSGVRNQLDGRESAGKTGTSDKNNESWFAGYTPNLATAVWVGTPDDGNKRLMKNVRIGGSFYPVMHGASIAAPIWKGIMSRALEGEPIIKFKEPSDKVLNGDLIDIPSVNGRTVAEATKILEDAGFGVDVGGSMASSIPKGLVAGTSPFGRAPKGSVVTIYTSEGPSEPKDKDKGKPDPSQTITIEPPPDGGGGPGKPPKPDSTLTTEATG
ncbi:transglycosylase domain-containing protein [Intrasporangium calvum]|uniref:Transglycosylase domain-containing protein n=1 Tax=Intrasporangium calvum TaxID=53358 RepID=A0ABT5GGJ8_9MICO|nr:transglycosylase domain-containing protein [Intrasporangium calvum]MDC5697046.1 transglycosylase domain-containing protein [Intrasporangium calvum]